MERKKFTTTLTPKACMGLDILKNLYDMQGRNDVIEYLINKDLEENDLEEIVNAAFKKDNE